MGFRTEGLVCLLTLTQGVCWAFNIGTKNAQFYEGPEDAQFGYTVRQYAERSNNWLLVGAPSLLSSGPRTGDLYKCPVPSHNGNCEKLQFSDSITIPDVSEVRENMSLGLSLAVHPRTKSIMSCAPLWAHECGSLYFPVGACALAGSNFRQLGRPFAPTMTGCRSFLDIVFVLDGSNSIWPWPSVLDFLSSILETFPIGPGQTQVGIMQYGETVSNEMSLKKFTNKAQLKIAASNIPQRGGQLTNTAMGIETARATAFLPENGGRAEASKVMIVVTDGESSDAYKLPGVIEKCNNDGITRFGIAVLDYYLSSNIPVEKLQAEIRSIASTPTEKYYFDVKSTGALVDITKALGERIYSLEGTSDISTFEMEMSEAGFSILPVKDGWLLGAVGAFDWLGTVLHVPDAGGAGSVLLPPAALAAEFPPSLKNHNTYLGYSLSSASLQGKTLYIAGAPRYNHTGKVVTFGRDDTSTDYAIRQALVGEQIGSYFGGEVCAMDVDGDSVSDVLLVAAPMFMDSSRKETGRVYLYTFSPQGVLEWSAHLSPAESQDSRFGSALAAVPDLNQDGWGELAVGAPLEDERQGAVYLFQGHGRSLRTTHVQRVAASALGPNRLQYFGRALHGMLDMDRSGIPDLAVGANGKAVLLWSRAIARVSVTVKFNPNKINMMDKTCKGMGQDAVCVMAQLCLSANVRPAQMAGSPLELVYNMTLDPVRSVSRAHFVGGVERTLQGTATVRPDTSSPFCRDYTFYVMELADIVKPLELRVDLALKDPEQGPVLDAEELSSKIFELPFTKDCGTDERCETDLVLTLEHDIKGTRESPYVVRSERNKHVVSITLENRRENAYNTRLNFTYSPNQELRNIDTEDGDVSVDCTVPKDHPHSQLCKIGFPVFRASAKMTIRFIFEFSRKNIMSTASFSAEVKSDSEETAQQLENNSARISVPLYYEADIILFRDSNLAQLEVNDKAQRLDIIKGLDDIGPELKYTFKVQKFGFPLPEEIQLKISLPMFTAQNNRLLYVTNVRSSPPEMITCDTAGIVDPLNIAKHQYEVQQTTEDLSNVEELTCPDVQCSVFTCTLGRLDEGKDASVTITSRFWNTTFATAKFKSVKLVSRGRLELGPSSFLLIPKGSEERTVELEVTRLESGEVPVGIIIGSIIGGLLLLALLIFGLWKLGFFRRRYKQLLQEAGPDGGETNPLSDMNTVEE
ncbi:integrin alpha-11-like [Lampetra planeri]